MFLLQVDDNDVLFSSENVIKMFGGLVQNYCNYFILYKKLQ